MSIKVRFKTRLFVRDTASASKRSGRHARWYDISNELLKPIGLITPSRAGARGLNLTPASTDRGPNLLFRLAHVDHRRRDRRAGCNPPYEVINSKTQVVAGMDGSARSFSLRPASREKSSSATGSACSAATIEGAARKARDGRGRRRCRMQPGATRRGRRRADRRGARAAADGYAGERSRPSQAG
jgi:hypothetical protein